MFKFNLGETVFFIDNGLIYQINLVIILFILWFIFIIVFFYYFNYF